MEELEPIEITCTVCGEPTSDNIRMDDASGCIVASCKEHLVPSNKKVARAFESFVSRYSPPDNQKLFRLELMMLVTLAEREQIASTLERFSSNIHDNQSPQISE